MLEVFEHTTEALAGVDLVDRLQREMNKTTVYRILERLVDEGLVHSFKDQDGLQWFAKCQGCSSSHHTDSHPHFQCRDCGKTECLSLDIPVPSVPYHKIDSAEFLLIGICDDCLCE